MTNQHLGEGLAAGFNPSTLSSKATSLIKNYIISSQPSPVEFPQHPTVLMRGHGFTCVATTIEEVVYRAIFTCTNARIQTTALLLQSGYNQGLMAERSGAKEDAGPAKQEGVKFLSEREARDAWTANQGHAERPWGLWCEEVRGCGLNRNEVEVEEDVVAG